MGRDPTEGKKGKPLFNRKERFPLEFCFFTIYLLKYCKIRDGFFVLSKLSEGRRSNATLTGTKQRQNG